MRNKKTKFFESEFFQCLVFAFITAVAFSLVMFINANTFFALRWIDFVYNEVAFVITFITGGITGVIMYITKELWID